MSEIFTPYSTARPFFSGNAPPYASLDDAERIQAYQLYEELYWGESTVGVEVEDGDPIRVPTAKVIVEAVHRFLAAKWTFNVVGITGDDTTAVEGAKVAFTKLFRREQIEAKVSSNKRYGLIRGDAILHIIADPNKPEGSRISVEELDPATYFPIYDLDDPHKILGCHIVDILLDAEGKAVARRLTYRKEVDENDVPTGLITSEVGMYESSGWDDRFDADPDDIKLLQIIQPEMALPEDIKALPVYHWKNTRNPADIFGSSVLRGLEKPIKAIDQTTTDTDIALALASLGVYATDSGTPESGVWQIGPARVIETKPGTSFTRVPGITSIQPALDHSNYLEDKSRAGAGVPAIAAGDVDVSIAQSGIALALQMLPLTAANAERELEMLSVLNHFLYDLQTMWFPAYEGLSFGEGVLVESITSDPIPTDRAGVITEVIELVTAGLITMQMAIDRLAELGWEYPENAISTMLQDSANRVKVTDPFSARLVMRDEMDAARKDARATVKAADDTSSQ